MPSLIRCTSEGATSTMASHGCLPSQRPSFTVHTNTELRLSRNAIFLPLLLVSPKICDGYTDRASPFCCIFPDWLFWRVKWWHYGVITMTAYDVGDTCPLILVLANGCRRCMVHQSHVSWRLIGYDEACVSQWRGSLDPGLSSGQFLHSGSPCRCCFCCSRSFSRGDGPEDHSDYKQNQIKIWLNRIFIK